MVILKSHVFSLYGHVVILDPHEGASAPWKSILTKV